MNNHASSKIQKQVYKSLPAARAACAKDAECTAVNRKSSTHYQLCKGHGVRPETGYNTYIKGGKEEGSQSFTVSHSGYTWKYSAPFELSETYTTKKSISAALKACASDSKCKGVTSTSSDEFKLAKGSVPSPKPKSQSWVKSGDGTIFTSVKLFTIHKGNKCTGYASTKVYTSLASALEDCGLKSACNCVTKEGSKKYRLNTGSTPKTSSGNNAWVQESDYDTQSDYRFIETAGYVSAKFLNKKAYKTEKSAKKACAGKSGCVGVSKVKTKNYRLNKGGVVKASTKGILWTKGDYYTTERIVSFGNRAYIGKSPVGMTGKKLGTATDIGGAMALCAKKKGCNGFEWNGKKFTAYAYTKLVKPKPGHVAFVYSGVKLTSDSHLWAMKEGYRMTGYDSSTIYKSVSKATKACAASATCQVYYFWTIMNNHASSKIQKQVYKSLPAARAACAKDAECTAVNRKSSTHYQLCKGHGVRPETGYNTYIKGGKEEGSQSFTVSHSGYTWKYSAPFELSETYTTKKSISAALKACASDSKCKGVTSTSSDEFKLAKGSVPSPKPKSQSWVKSGDGTIFTSVKLFTIHKGNKCTGYASTKVYTSLASALEDCGKIQKQVYKSLPAARAACAKDAECTAVNRKSSTHYQLCKGHGVRPETGYNTYIKGGKEEGSQSFTVSHSGYTWKYSAPFELSETYTTKKSISAALKACASDSKCKGVTSTSSDEFKLAKGSVPSPKPKSQSWVKSGDGTIFTSVKLFTIHKGNKCTGYASTKVYTSLASALEDCGLKSACNCVTKEGSKKYRLNTGSTPKTSSGNNAWVQESDYDTQSDYRFIETAGYVSAKFINKKVYKTEKSAKKACAGKSGCVGVSKVKTKNYREREREGIERERYTAHARGAHRTCGSDNQLKINNDLAVLKFN
eukprot:sb/3461833/